MTWMRLFSDSNIFTSVHDTSVASGSRLSDSFNLPSTMYLRHFFLPPVTLLFPSLGYYLREVPMNPFS